MTDYTGADMNAVILTEVGVCGLGVLGVAVTAPSGAEGLLALASFGVAAFNLRPGSPFERVAFAYETIAKRLDELENGGETTKGIQALRKKVADAWEGPGAEAFDSYIDGKGSDDLVAGIRDLRKACDQIGPLYKKMAESLSWSLEGYFVLGIANTVIQVALNYILADSLGTTSPWVIPAKFAAGSLTIMAIVGLVSDVVSGLTSDSDTTKDLSQAAKSLVKKMEDKSNWINSDALALSKEKLDSVGNPDDWSKE